MGAVLASPGRGIRAGGVISMLPLLSATVSLVTPSKPFYLGIDAGTQSTKAVVYDAAQK